jgi:signal transduction histidine kinase
MTAVRWLVRERRVGGRRAPSVVDWLVALGLMAIALLEIAAGAYPGPTAVAVVAQLAATLPVAFRRVAPLPAITASAAASLPYVVAFGTSTGVANAGTILLLVYSVGRHTSGRGLMAGTALAMLLLVEQLVGAHLPLGPGGLAYYLILLGGVLGVGITLRVQTERAIAQALAADRARHEQAETARAAVQAERGRIARELQAVVAQNVGLIVLEAGGARSVLDDDPVRATAAVRQVEETGRQTLAEMRRLVGILREDEFEGQQGLPDLDRLSAPIGATLPLPANTR